LLIFGSRNIAQYTFKHAQGGPLQASIDVRVGVQHDADLSRPEDLLNHLC